MSWFALLFHPLPPCPAPALEGHTVQLSVSAFGKKLGGLGVIDLSSERYALTLLSPTGPELFRVEGPPYTVTSAVATWTPWLGRLPVERDLRTLFTEVPEGGCRLSGGRLRTRAAADGWTHEWRGRGGPATATRSGDRRTLHDRRYDIVTIDLPALPPPDEI